MPFLTLHYSSCSAGQFNPNCLYKYLKVKQTQSESGLALKRQGELFSVSPLL